MFPMSVGELMGGVTRSQVTFQQSSVPMQVTVTNRNESAHSQRLPQDTGNLGGMIRRKG